MGYPDYLVHYNKNHDKRTGRFTFGDGNGDGVSPDDYRTPELDKKYDELKKTGIFNNRPEKWLTPNEDPDKEWGKDWARAARIGLEAQKRWYGADDNEDNDMLSWFMFEDQTIGMPEVAYLVNAGWSKDKIIDIFQTADKFRDQNNKYEDDYVADKGFKVGEKGWSKVFTEAFNSSPYNGTYNMMEGYWQMDGKSSDAGEFGKFIDDCIKVSKEMEHSDMDYSNTDYLVHFNPNHDKKNGQFTFSPDTPKVRPFAKSEGKLNSPSEKWKYKKERKKDLRGEGYTKTGARTFAQTEANIKLGLARQRNRYVKENIKYTKKADKYREAGNKEKAKAWTDKAILSYKNAKLTETYMNDKSIQDLGKVMVNTLSAEFVKGMILADNAPRFAVSISL